MRRYGSGESVYPAAPPGRRHRACCGHKSPHRCGRRSPCRSGSRGWRPAVPASPPGSDPRCRRLPEKAGGHTLAPDVYSGRPARSLPAVAGGGQTAERFIRVRLCLGLHQIHILWLLYIINKTDGFVKKNFESICESLTEQENCPLSRTSTPSSFLSQGGDLVRQPLRRRLGRILIPGLHHDPHQGLSARGAHQHPALARPASPPPQPRHRPGPGWP